MTWLRCQNPVPGPESRLICFPHAGGSASFYRDWGNSLPGIEVHAVSYPGRADRITDPLATDLRELAAEIAKAMIPLADRPIALFGHSMGALIAFESARLLEADGVRPTHLFVSGAAAPHLERATGRRRTYDAESAIEAMAALGGTDATLLATPAFRELVLPYVLGDLQMAEVYRAAPTPLLSCPVTGLFGTDDPEVSPEECASWAELTTAAFTSHGVAGGHFYLASDPPFKRIEIVTG